MRFKVSATRNQTQPPLASKEPRVEGERSGDVRGKVSEVVTAGIDVKFVSDLARRENFIERGGPSFKAVIILVAAIEINVQAEKNRGTRQREWTVDVPKRNVRRNAENRSENARSCGLRRIHESWKLFDERGTMRTDRTKKMGMAES